jgi:accessory gene regulator B
MGFIETTAARTARSIRRHDPNAASEAVLQYALVIVLNTAAILTLSVAISALTGRVGATIVALTSFGCLKFFSGGIHLRSSAGCTFASTAMLLTVVHVPYRFEYGGPFLLLLSMLLFLLYAPSGQIRRGTLPERYIPYLKWGAVLFCLAALVLRSPVLTLVIAVQAVSLTPAAFRFVDFMERRCTR